MNCFWKSKKVFITGHTGFKGATLCRRLLCMGAIVTGYALAPRQTLNAFDLYGLRDENTMTSILGDIRDLEALKKAVFQAEPEVVFHLAAQPLVRDSYEYPAYTFETNLMGTVNILEAAREYCRGYSERFRAEPLRPLKSIVNVTTDKVYLNEEGRTKPFTEDEKLCGYDPYSNSKSGSELIAYSYKNSFFSGENMPALSTARAGNVIGFGDFAKDRIIPDCIRAAICDEHVSVRNPNSIRPYQHVEDCIEGYLLLAEKQFLDKETYEGCYNFGPKREDCITTGRLTQLFEKHWKAAVPGSGFYVEINGDSEGPREADILTLDSEKAYGILGWKPKRSVEQAIEKTIKDAVAYLGIIKPQVEQRLKVKTDAQMQAGKAIKLDAQMQTGKAIKPIAQVKTSDEAMHRKKILDDVSEYCSNFHGKKDYRGGDRIPYAGRIYDGEEMVNLVDSALDFWLTAGRYAERFETDFAEFLGVRHCALVNSGSSANLLAFMALTSPLLGERTVKRGDEIITVAAGFPTTVAPMVQFGAVPIFVDVTIPEYNVDVTKLEGALTNRTRAVMLAHTLGNPFDLKSVKRFCEKNNLWLIEDNCDALGSRYCMDGVWNYTGTFGDIGTSSFYPPHHMTMGEGGAVYTDNPLLAKIVQSMRDWGRDCQCPSGADNLCGHRFDGKHGQLPLGYDHKYVYSHFGYNMKATEMQAAIGLAQLKKLPGFIEARKYNFEKLKERIKQLGDQYKNIEILDDKEKKSKELNDVNSVGKRGLNAAADMSKDIKGKMVLSEKTATHDFILPVAAPNSEPSWFGFLVTCKDGQTRNSAVEYLEDKGIQTRMLFAGNILKHPCFEGMTEGWDYRVAGELPCTDRIMNDAFWVGVYPGMTEEMIEKMAEEIVWALGGR